MIRLRGFLDLVRTHGGGEVRAWELASALALDGSEVRSALRHEGIVRSGPRAETVPCPGLGCAREVRELARDGASEPRRLFGVCTRDPAECEMVDVAELEVAQEIISRDALVGALQRALRITPTPDAPASLAPLDVTVLGQESDAGETHDVLLAWRPGSMALRAMVAEREGRGRKTRVLTLADLASA